MGFLILNAMITGLCTGFRGSTFIVLGGRFSKRLREHLFGSLLSQEADFFGAVKTGDITSRLSADCQKVGDQVQLNVQVTGRRRHHHHHHLHHRTPLLSILSVQVFFRSLIQAVITLVWMFVINPKLAATCFVVVPAIVYASRRALDAAEGGARPARLLLLTPLLLLLQVRLKNLRRLHAHALDRDPGLAR